MGNDSIQHLEKECKLAIDGREPATGSTGKPENANPFSKEVRYRCETTRATVRFLSREIRRVEAHIIAVANAVDLAYAAMDRISASAEKISSATSDITETMVQDKRPDAIGGLLMLQTAMAGEISENTSRNAKTLESAHRRLVDTFNEIRRMGNQIEHIRTDSDGIDLCLGESAPGRKTQPG